MSEVYDSWLMREVRTVEEFGMVPLPHLDMKRQGLVMRAYENKFGRVIYYEEGIPCIKLGELRPEDPNQTYALLIGQCIDRRKAIG